MGIDFRFKRLKSWPTVTMTIILHQSRATRQLRILFCSIIDEFFKDYRSAFEFLRHFTVLFCCRILSCRYQKLDQGGRGIFPFRGVGGHRGGVSVLFRIRRVSLIIIYIIYLPFANIHVKYCWFVIWLFHKFTCLCDVTRFDVIASSCEEARNPRRDIPIALAISLVVVTFSYVGVSSVLTLMVPW